MILCPPAQGPPYLHPIPVILAILSPRSPGMSTGIVTNARLTHSTPASAYAHSPSRFWEGEVKDDDHVEDDQLCAGVVDDIATQLVRDNGNITVISSCKIIGILR